MEDTFSCPKCHMRLPFTRVFLLNNFSKFRCKGCSTLIKPHRRTMENIGGGGVAVMLPIMLIIYKVLGVGALLISFLLGYFAVCVITYKVTRFEKAEP